MRVIQIRGRVVRLILGIVLFLGLCFLWTISFSSGKNDSARISPSVMAFRYKRFAEYQKTQGQRSGPGEQGDAVHLEGKEKERAEKLGPKEAFNRIASDKISLQRAVPDMRDPRCKNITYPSELPSASVIIIYNNEAWSPLLRTVHSVINRSPPQYLHEVVLLDDFSDKPHLGEKLKAYVASTWPDGIVTMVRTNQRSGLIRAKIEGAKVATGDVIIVLDSHCEVNYGWLEPILARIKENRKTIICPIIDDINYDTLAYSKNGGYEIGGFSWAMHFKWIPIPARLVVNRKYTDPVESPTMAGGLLAVDREYFFEVGAYDPGMEIWGGENLEISFRVWMCGGRLEFLPCSRVGHIFRSSHPYSFMGNKDSHGINSRRVAEVWMDDYKRLYYIHRKDLLKNNNDDISERKALREKLSCKDFKWYLDNVYPEKFVIDKDVKTWGVLQNEASGLCFDSLNKDSSVEYILGLYFCTKRMSPSQIFSYGNDDKLRREEACMNAEPGDDGVVVMMLLCHKDKPTMKWTYNQEDDTVVNKETGKCLDIGTGKNAGDGVVVANTCSDATSQKWKFKKYV